MPSSRISGFVNVPVMPQSIGKIVRSWILIPSTTKGLESMVLSVMPQSIGKIVRSWIWDFHIFCGSKTSFLGAVSFFWKDFGEVWSLKLGI